MSKKFYLEKTDFYCSICGNSEEVKAVKTAEKNDNADQHVINICPKCKGGLIDALTFEAKPFINACQIEGCNHPIKARFLCDMHYQRLRRHGDPLKVVNTKHSCKIEGCEEERKAKGYCYKHLYSFQKYGDPLHTSKKEVQRICKFDGCDRHVHARGYCHKHVAWFYRGKLPE